MLGNESERRLKDLLVAVADGERRIEALRQRLCGIRDFATHAGFQRIDRDMSDFINSWELLNFLRDNGIHHVQEHELF